MNLTDFPKEVIIAGSWEAQENVQPCWSLLVGNVILPGKAGKPRGLKERLGGCKEREHRGWKREMEQAEA
jgi:hypothetical protein